MVNDVVLFGHVSKLGMFLNTSKLLFQFPFRDVDICPRQHRLEGDSDVPSLEKEVKVEIKVGDTLVFLGFFLC